MNYRHIYHAGNFADVLKHVALVLLLLHLRKKEKPFVVIDSHAGAGFYEIAGEQAAKTGEAKEGILRLFADEKHWPEPFKPFGEMAKTFAPGYPGSPLIAAKLLRSADRLIAIEKHPEESAALKRALAPYVRARVTMGDGYKDMLKPLPPPERRGVILVDPPYEDEDEFSAAASALSAAYRRFATGIYALWYPAKSQGPVQSVIGELLNDGVENLMRIELDVGHAPGEEEGRLSATGLLIINAPYGFKEAMEQVLPYLAKLLARGPGARFTVEIVAGE